MFPEDPILIARGKYSTLNKERHEQIKRVQDTCRTIQGAVTLILTDAQEKPPADGSHLELVGKCFENLKSARERLITLSLGLNELEEEAWGK
jgi:hypothetical protein